MSEEVQSTPDLNEFERSPVPGSHWKDWRSFLGMYAGEHTAGTEFMIGPLFLTTGVSAFDLIIGLIVGNLFAVLSWRFLTAPIATKTRLTLYYQLEKICGKNLVKVYNLANGLLFCFLAGAMITVAATAVGVPFDMNMPSLSDAYPTNLQWVLVVLAVGTVISYVAARGYNLVSRFSNIAAPWMILVFIACGIVALIRLDVQSLSDFWAIWGEGSIPMGGQTKYTFWHVVFWSWLVNAAMHIGMSDLTVFRYAKSSGAGWTTAAGMYVGHYIAWICAALLYVLYLKTPEAAVFLANGDAPPVAPGPMAYDAVGIAGLICVVVAGWTTANPTIYRAGLAFQAIIPRSSTYKVTLATGAIATVAGMFPAFAMKLLDFVALYGFILAPMGAIILFDIYMSSRFHVVSNYAEKAGIKFNVSVFLAWGLSAGLFYFLSVSQNIFLPFLTIPAWITSGFLFLLFSRYQQKDLS